MAPARGSRSRANVSGDEAMLGILALLVAEREERVKGDKTAAKTEVILARAGLSVEAIVGLTGKNADAVRKSIQRSRS